MLNQPMDTELRVHFAKPMHRVWRYLQALISARYFPAACRIKASQRFAIGPAQHRAPVLALQTTWYLLECMTSWFALYPSSAIPKEYTEGAIECNGSLISQPQKGRGFTLLLRKLSPFGSHVSSGSFEGSPEKGERGCGYHLRETGD